MILTNDVLDKIKRECKDIKHGSVTLYINPKRVTLEVTKNSLLIDNDAVRTETLTR